MDWAASKREFDSFAAEAADPLLRTGYLMTGDAGDAEDLVQETFLRIARRWNRVRSMDHSAAYARRILINLALDDAGRRSRQKAELGPQGTGIEAVDEPAARALREVDDLAEFGERHVVGQASVVDEHLDGHGLDFTADPQHLIGAGQIRQDRPYRHRVGGCQAGREFAETL